MAAVVAIEDDAGRDDTSISVKISALAKDHNEIQSGGVSVISDGSATDQRLGHDWAMLEL